MNLKAKTRFDAYIDTAFPMLQQALARQNVHLSSADDFKDLFDWAWMNCATRCFGHPHVPNEIAMVPLLDLVNHQQE